MRNMELYVDLSCVILCYSRCSFFSCVIFILSSFRVTSFYRDTNIHQSLYRTPRKKQQRFVKSQLHILIGLYDSVHGDILFRGSDVRS